MAKQQKNCELTDYDIISDILGNQKSLVTLYSTSLIEVAEEPLRTILSDKMTEAATDQFDAFNYMHDRGMYKTEPAPSQKIKEAKEKFSCCECGIVTGCGCE